MFTRESYVQPLTAAPWGEMNTPLQTTPQVLARPLGKLTPCPQGSVSQQTQQSQSGMTRRQKQRLRKKEMKGQSAAEDGNKFTNPEHLIVDLPQAEPASLPTAGIQVNCTTRVQEMVTDVASKETDMAVTFQVQSCLRGMLSRVWTNLKKEFEVQALIWSSLPSRSTSGRGELGVVEGSPEAHMHTLIQTCLQLASSDSLLATSTAQLIVQQPIWDDTVLSVTMTQAVQAVLAAKTKGDCLTKLPQSILSSGRTAEAALQERTPTETLEMKALIAACNLEECDTRLVFRAFGVPEDLDEPTRRINHDREGIVPPEQFGLQPVTLSKRRIKVKNTFVELDDSSDDPDGTCSRSGSSVRSMSVPSRSSVDSDYEPSLGRRGK